MMQKVGSHMSCYSTAQCGNVYKYTRSYKYTIPGKPIPLMRPRFSRKGHVWDAQAHLKEGVAELLRFQHGKQPLMNGPLHLDITFYMYLSPHFSKKKRQELLNTPHPSRPDLSNMLKFVEDVCLNIIYHDDSVIGSICASKVYSDTPRTEFTFGEIITKSEPECE